MFKHLELNIEIPIVVNFTYDKHANPKFSGKHGNWLPGDEATITSLRVYLVKDVNKRVDITNYLSVYELEKITQECYEEIYSEVQ